MPARWGRKKSDPPRARMAAHQAGGVTGIRIRIHRPAGPRTPLRPAVFLDRDGVIVEEVNYLHRVEDLRLIPGALEAVARLNDAGLPVVVVTNQAGVGRGYYGWNDFDRVQEAIERELALAGGWFNGVWACGYHPQGAGEYARDHPFRKPHPGMLIDAAAKLRLELAASWLVGDKPIDIEAAAAAGLGHAVLVETGYGAALRAEVERRDWGRCRVEVVSNLAEAVNRITGGDARQE